MTSDSKDKSFSADISDDAIKEALRAVEELESTSEGELALSVDGEIVPLVEDGEAEAPASERSLLHELEVVVDEGEDEPPEASSEADEEIARLHDRIAFLGAELENLRKRSQREREELERFAVEKLLLELIPVLDNFDRAEAHASSSQEPAGLAEGVRMAQRLFEETLGRFGVRAFSAVGEPFDPAFHEAVQLVESAEHPPNVVVREMVRGYLLHDRLVRPAMVCVSTGTPGDGGGGTAA